MVAVRTSPFPVALPRGGGALLGLGALVVLSLRLRTGALDAGYWIDEAISLGIADRPVVDIPHALLLDGSPPLYYVLLHAWMLAVGDGEAATRSLSLLIGLLAVPAAYWAGRAAFGAHAAWLAAGGAALCPFLIQYAQETRMYTLVAVLSMTASAGFVLAFVRGRAVHRWTFAVSLASCCTPTTGACSSPAASSSPGWPCGGAASSSRATRGCSAWSRSPTPRGCRACCRRPRAPARHGPSGRGSGS